MQAPLLKRCMNLAPNITVKKCLVFDLMSKKESYFQPPWWLANSHLQTLWAPMLPQQSIPKLERHRIELDDGDFLDVDWVGKERQAPTVILLHGLEGGSDSPYIRRMLRKLDKENWRALLVYWRGCSGEPNRLPVTYHAGRSGDLAAVVRYLKTESNSHPTMAVGYSLGANILLKWLGEEGDNAEINYGFAVSTPFDLGICSRSIDKGMSKIYKHYLLTTLKKKIITKYSSEELLKLLNLTAKDILLIRSMQEFDARITVRLNGFENAEDYYAQASSKYYLKNIKRPTLILHAEDDPFMSPEIIPDESELSEFLELRVSKKGGHVGFVSEPDKRGQSDYLENTIFDYFSKALKNE